MTLSVLLPLIFIPSIRSKAGYVPEYPVSGSYVGTDFSYSYKDVAFKFYDDPDVIWWPSDYQIDYRVLNYAIDSIFGAHCLSYAGEGYLVSAVNSWFNTVTSLAQNYLLANWELYSNLFGTPSGYPITYELIGVYDSNSGWSGYDPLYGDCFKFRFKDGLGFDEYLLLDDHGYFYGENTQYAYNIITQPSQVIIGDIIDTQIDPNDDIYIPSVGVYDFESMLPPYISGKELHFFIYVNGVPIHYFYPDFTNCAIVQFPYNAWGDVLTPGGFGLIDTHNNSSPTNYIKNYSTGENLTWNMGKDWNRFTYNNVEFTGYRGTIFLSYLGNNISFNCPSYRYTSSGQTNIGNITSSVNSKGMVNNSGYLADTKPIFLFKAKVNPITVTPDVPIDIPIPSDDVEPWPDENLPDDDPTGTPTPVDPFDPDPVPDQPDDPDPEPTVPAIPPIVSGNDDIWPDLNVMFDFELDLDSFLGPLLNFDFPDFNTVIDSVLGPLSWISGIMSLLYEGSDFGVLFTILAVFFIASAILGIYKWWNN